MKKKKKEIQKILLSNTQLKFLLRKNYTQYVNFASVTKKYNFVLKQLHEKHMSFGFKPTHLYLKYLYLNTIQYNLLKTLKNLKKQTTYLNIDNSNNIQGQHLNFSELQFSRIFTSRVEKRKKPCYYLLKKKIQKNNIFFLKVKSNPILTNGLNTTKKKKKKIFRLNLMSFAHKKNNILKSKKLVKFVCSLNQKLAFRFLNPNFFSKKLRFKANQKLPTSFKYPCGTLNRDENFLYKKVKGLMKLKKLRKFYLRTFRKFRKLKKRRFYSLKKKIRRRRRLKKFLGYWVKRKGKKRLKLRIPPIFRYYRNRHRLYFHFYIPRFLEINYKTFCFIHLDTVEYSTIGHKIPLILNLGKVQTKVSF